MKTLFMAFQSLDTVKNFRNFTLLVELILFQSRYFLFQLDHKPKKVVIIILEIEGHSLQRCEIKS